jgi:hypothetical protein
MLVDKPFLYDNSKIPEVFSCLKTHSVPDKLSYRNFSLWGFKSSRDRKFIEVFRFLGFLDSDNVPTSLYKSFHMSPTPSVVLKTPLNSKYKDFLDLISSQRFTNSSYLKKYLYQNSLVKKSELNKIVDTFVALFLFANLDPFETLTSSTIVKKGKSTISLNIHLPSTTDKSVYEYIFDNLRDLLD